MRQLCRYAVTAICGLISSHVLADPLCRPGDARSYEDCCYETDARLKAYCPSQSKPRREPPPSDDRCDALGTRVVPEVVAEVHADERPVVDRSFDSNALSRAHPKEAINGIRTGETSHMDLVSSNAKGTVLTPYPFQAWLPTWHLYSSVQHKHVCVALTRATFPYNPLRIFIPPEFEACESRIFEHEIQHYMFISGLDEHFSGQLTTRIERLGLPSQSKPAMVKPSELQRLKSDVVGRINSTWDSLATDYVEKAMAHKHAVDTSAEYNRLCRSCLAWPPNVCRRSGR